MFINSFPLVTTLRQADADPFLKPYWRWAAALNKVELPRRWRVKPEPEIAEAIAFLKGKRCPRRSQIDIARVIFEEDGLQRAELEARILAGQTDDEIAEYCDLPAEVITVYEELFFFVRRYYRATDWLLTNTVGRSHWYGFQNHQLRQLWAWLAMAGGPIILDYLVVAYRAAIGSGKTFGIDEYFNKDSPLDLGIRGYIAMLIIPPDRALEWEMALDGRWRLISALEDPQIRQQEAEDFHRECISMARKVVGGMSCRSPNPRPKKRPNRQPPETQ